MNNKLLFLMIFFLCGKAYALPQDWPCFGLEVRKQKVIRDTDIYFEYFYEGETNGYIVSINLFGLHKFPTSFADCGNSGCLGKIMEKETGRTETLKFYCEEYNEDYTRIICHVGFGEEAVFDKENGGNYTLHYCPEDTNKSLRFNVSDCKKCYCTMYWYEGNIQNKIGNYGMGCKKEGNKAHCFTYDGYASSRNFENKEDDFEKCIGLEW